MALTTHGDLYDFNIMKSVEHFVRSNTAFMAAYPEILFDDTQFKPTRDQWLEFEWIEFGPTIFSKNTFHVRCFSRSLNDRYGRVREKLVGDVNNLLSVTDGNVTFYDFMNHPSDFEDNPVQIDGEDVKIAIRFAGRSPILDGEEMGESSQLKGVHLVVLSYDAHVARIHVQH